MNIRLHLGERAGQNRDDDEIGSFQRFRQRLHCLVTPAADGLGMLLQPVADLLVSFGGRKLISYKATVPESAGSKARSLINPQAPAA
ncbi:hypothetical protein HMSSN036_05420 [Paenibacillus macerans]|nr:hypothetical protein HMSSN036_05420 [Paenibacillus macerans]